MRSSPSRKIDPDVMARLRRCRPRMAWLVTDLPEPDSPTIPIVWPRSSVKLSPSTALTTPSSVGKCTLRSRSSRYPPAVVAAPDAGAGVVVASRSAMVVLSFDPGVSAGGGCR
jgi:hypothetical protein